MLFVGFIKKEFTNDRKDSKELLHVRKSSWKIISLTAYLQGWYNGQIIQCKEFLFSTHQEIATYNKKIKIMTRLNNKIKIKTMYNKTLVKVCVKLNTSINLFFYRSIYILN